MRYAPLGKTNLQVSHISFGASSLGGVFREVAETKAIEAVLAAIEMGINYIDVAPAYGGTKAEIVLGMALRQVPRDQYYLSTKVGKYTAINNYGQDKFDYSAAGIKKSLEESAQRIGVDYFDIVHLHDIEYNNRQHTEWALSEGIQTLQELKASRQIGAVGIGMYPVDLWERVIQEELIDVGLSHNIYSLNDTRLEGLLPLAAAKGIGMISASPFSSGLLTTRGAPAWHPATAEQRAIFAAAAAYCQKMGTPIEKLAIQFSSQNPHISTTLFSSADPDSVRRNLAWCEEPIDQHLLQQVRQILAPVTNVNWKY
ncbi:MAG: aldo/keto reductase [Sediminibacterium sp.]|nr:aldo/keto reductase [Sediminibacterium sp.]